MVINHVDYEDDDHADHDDDVDGDDDAVDGWGREAIWCVEITNKTMIRMLITMVVAMMMMMQSKLLRMMMMPLRETWPTGVLEWHNLADTWRPPINYHAGWWSWEGFCNVTMMILKMTMLVMTILGDDD